MRPQLVANEEKEHQAEDDGYDLQRAIFALQHSVSFPVRVASICHANSSVAQSLEGEPRRSVPVPLQVLPIHEADKTTLLGRSPFFLFGDPALCSEKPHRNQSESATHYFSPNGPTINVEFEAQGEVEH
jgi:hypothetical protein